MFWRGWGGSRGVESGVIRGFGMYFGFEGGEAGLGLWVGGLGLLLGCGFLRV